VFDAFRKSLAANRAQFYRDVAANPFYGFNRPGAKPSQPTLASSFVGHSSYSFYSAIKGRALLAFEALGQVLPAALPRNAIAPSVADPNS
jgi:hypothetical protein